MVAEKEPGVYAELVAGEGLDPTRTWMIGNSIKSDVNPALAVGLGAVFIPNDNTWALEHTTLDAGDERILHLRVFTELLDHF